MRWLLVALTLFVSVLVSGDALACMNATMSESEAVRKLKDAEVALEQGDVITARDLAGDVNDIYGLMTSGFSDPIVIRAARVEALAYVRDRASTDEQLERATSNLREWVNQHENVRGTLPPTPPLLADFGEALERSGKGDEAYAVLVPLADKDLIGSGYAYAALARAAKEKGDAAHADLAMKRCESTAVNLAACRGEYPKQPILRGQPIDFSVVAFLFIGLAGVRLVRKKTPWSAFRAPMFAAIVVAFAGVSFVLANLRVGWPAIAIVAPLILFLGLVQRALWVSAVRRGKVAGFTIRRAEPEDAAPGTLWFLDGPPLPEVLEASIDPHYRDSARPPILFRLEQNKVKLSRVFAIGVAVAILAGCVIVLTSLTRGR